MKISHMRPMLTAIAAAVSVFAAQAQSVSATESESGRVWFVELEGAPTADGRSNAQVQIEKETFRSTARAANVRFKERRSYSALFNGFTVEVGAADRAKLMRLPGVKAIYPVTQVEAPSPLQVAGNALDLAAAIELTGAKVAQQTLGLTGRGIKVGIIDTGIDLDHPAFGGSGTPGTATFPTARVVAGYDFVGDAYDSSSANPAAQVPQPDDNPDDCNGHGTHVAGIVGANGGGLVGVAPGVSFGAYRVFGCTGTTSSEIIVAALEKAYEDGMDVINQSLGSGRQWPQYPTAQAASRLVKKGVVVVASIGNNGPGGSSPDALFAAGAPGVGDNVIGVASFDNAQLSFAVAGTPYGYNSASASPLAPTTGSLPMSKTGTPATANDGCVALPAGSLTGTAALIRRGTCGFAVKAANAQAAGAAAVVLYNNAAGALNPTVAGAVPITIPVVAVTAAQGAALDAAIAAGPTTLNWSANYVSWPFGTGGLISGFSSYGLTAELDLKPNVGAPGGGILSSYPLEQGGQAVLSGTSMSSPHVAGAAALILEADPKIRSTQMMARMQNTADPKNWAGNPGLGFLEPAHRQGAGMLDIMGTIQATSMVMPSQLSLGESQAGPQTRRLEVTNTTRAPVTYTVSHVAGLATGPNTQTGASYNISGIFDAPATVSFSKTSFTVPPRGKAAFDVTIDANAALPDRSIYGGYVVLTASNGTAPLRVPFAGFKGDYQATQVLTPTANGFPWLASLSGTSLVNQPSGASYTMADESSIPYFLIHLDHLSRRLVLEAYDADTGRSWHKVSLDEYVTRNSTPGGFFTFTWDGTTFRGKGTNPKQWTTVPNGRYVVKVKALKALGDDDNTADTEVWTSPVITIARP